MTLPCTSQEGDAPAWADIWAGGLGLGVGGVEPNPPSISFGPSKLWLQNTKHLTKQLANVIAVHALLPGFASPRNRLGPASLQSLQSSNPSNPSNPSNQSHDSGFAATPPHPVSGEAGFVWQGRQQVPPERPPRLTSKDWWRGGDVARALPGRTSRAAIMASTQTHSWLPVVRNVSAVFNAAPDKQASDSHRHAVCSCIAYFRNSRLS